MSNEVLYNKKLFDVLKDLSKISPQIILTKEEDSIVSYQQTPDKSIRFSLSAPKSYFQFEQDEVAIYNFPEFYQFFSLFENPKFYISNQKINFEENDSCLGYYFSSPASCFRGIKTIWEKFPTAVKFTLLQKDLDSLIKASNLIVSSDKNKKAKIYVKDNIVKIELVGTNINQKNNEHNQSYNKVFECTSLSEYSPFSYMIGSDFFINLTRNADIDIEIKETGQIKAFYKIDDISVSIFSTKVNVNERNKQ